MLKLFYITNKPEVARIAESAGVDRIFVDMEYIGKDERQGGMDTVKNHHTVSDVENIRNSISKAELLVRVNPLQDRSKAEIDDVIKAGADVIMLPMWKTVDDVKRFVDLVDGRAKTLPLLETDEAYRCIEDAACVEGVDEIHIGLNDLHISQGKKFLFELLVDGTVDNIAKVLNDNSICFGFGGFGRVNQNNILPAENIIAEHYRLGSSMAILSRAFCNTQNDCDLESVREAFFNGIKENREYEMSIAKKDEQFFKNIHMQTAKIINEIVSKK